MGKLQSLKEYGYYLEEDTDKLYLLEGTDHFKTLLFESDIFKEVQTKDTYQLVIVNISEFSGTIVDAYISKKDYRTIVYPMFRGKSFKFIYRKLKNSKKIVKENNSVKLGGIRCKVEVDKENSKDAKIMANDIMEVLNSFIVDATDNNLLYELRVSGVLLNTMFGGVELAQNVFNALFRYFSAMCVEGGSVTVTLYFKQRL